MSAPDRAGHWRTTRGLMLVVLGAWALFAAAVLLAAEALDAVSLLGLLLAPVALLFWFARRQQAIDEGRGGADD